MDTPPQTETAPERAPRAELDPETLKDVLGIRSLVRTIDDALDVLSGCIRSIELDIEWGPRSGSPTSMQGKTLYRLRQKVTALMMARAGCRTLLRDIFTEGKADPIMHCRKIRTPEGVLEVTEEIQHVVGAAIQVWAVEDTDLDWLGGAIAKPLYKLFSKLAAVQLSLEDSPHQDQAIADAFQIGLRLKQLAGVPDDILVEALHSCCAPFAPPLSDPDSEEQGTALPTQEEDSVTSEGGPEEQEEAEQEAKADGA